MEGAEIGMAMLYFTRGVFVGALLGWGACRLYYGLLKRRGSSSGKATS